MLETDADATCTVTQTSTKDRNQLINEPVPLIGTQQLYKKKRMQKSPSVNNIQGNTFRKRQIDGQKPANGVPIVPFVRFPQKPTPLCGDLCGLLKNSLEYPYGVLPAKFELLTHRIVRF